MSARLEADRSAAGGFILRPGTYINPLPIVAEALSLCSASIYALDVGAGTGCNAIYLARHGIHVDAIDRHAAAIDKINEYAQARALPVRAKVHDLCESDPEFRGYGLVVCTLVLHHLTTPRATSFLANARMHATLGTLHVLGAITREGDFSGEFMPGERFYPNRDQLRRLYTDEDWEIQRAYEEECTMRQRHANGSAMRNIVSFLIARRTVR